jgi:hypothetical protein
MSGQSAPEFVVESGTGGGAAGLPGAGAGAGEREGEGRDRLMPLQARKAG